MTRVLKSSHTYAMTTPLICLILLLSCISGEKENFEFKGQFTQFSQGLHYLGVKSYSLFQSEGSTTMILNSEAFSDEENSITNFNDVEVLIHNDDLGFSELKLVYKSVYYSLKVGYEKGSLEFSEGNEKLLDYNGDFQMLSNRQRMILALMASAYIEISVDNTHKLTTKEFSERQQKFNFNKKVADGCKKTSVAVSLTRGDAEEEAKASRPSSDCIKSGSPGCTCVTGVWGGDNLCICFQIWNCTDPVTCMNLL